MRSTFCEVSSEQQGGAHEPMRNHERDSCPLFPSEGQELCRKLKQKVAVERNIKIRTGRASAQGLIGF
jgi:hypothetical protein